MRAVTPRAKTVDRRRPLRCVAAGGRISRDFSAQTTKLEIMTRFPIVIGDDDCVDLVVALDNGYLNSSGGWTNGAQTLQILGVAIERIDVPQSAAFRFGGVTTINLAGGVTEQLSNPLLPSAVGLSVWPKNTQFWIRCCAKVAAAGNLPLGVDTVVSGAQGWMYAAANRVEQTVSTGALTQPSGGVSSGVNGFGPSAILGRPLNSGKASGFALGASFFQGTGDGGTDSAVVGGVGLAGRITTAAGTLTGVVPMIEAAREGSSTLDFSTVTQALAYAKYTNFAVLNPGNSNSVAASITLAEIMAANRTIWSALRGYGVQRIVHTLIGPRTNLSNAPINSRFDVGGLAQQVNDAVTAAVATGEIAAVHDFNELRLSTDPSNAGYWKWADIAWTDDGVHPRDEDSYPAAAAILRGRVQALAGLV